MLSLLSCLPSVRSELCAVAIAIKESRPERVRRTGAFLRDAFIDYLAARVLFLAKLPEQGALLSSTAIEKCAKAIMALDGTDCEKVHLKPEHWTVLRSEPHFGKLLKGDFFQLNAMVYRLRYTVDLPLDYNLVIASREFLAEMDHTVLTIQSCFKFDQNGSHRLTGYEAAIARGDQRLLAENHLLSGIPVKQFVTSKPQSIYEVRRDPIRGFLEARYETEKPAKRKGFLRAALTFPDEGRVEYDMSHFPSRAALSLVRNGMEMIGGELEQQGP